MNTVYEAARERYLGIGIDTEAVLKTLGEIPISIHCWQGDDVIGFDHDGALTGGIQTTGNYPGRATTPAELMQDIEKVLTLVGGKHKLNLHACYAIFEDGVYADRDALLPKHFAPWVEFAKKNRMGIDFNPTFFSHPKASEFSLSSPDEEIRAFWVRHGQCCIRIAEYFAEETGIPCVINFWIPDGFKDTPADRVGPRARYKKSMDEILAIPYDKTKVFVTLESKVFGIGMESYTVGSGEFCMSYAIEKGITPLMDTGHYHPTEVVSDKISAMLLFADKIALHVSRPVRWDSDHVVRYDDETREIAKEIIASGRVNDIAIALDFFDASINRIAAWTIGIRNFRKALLSALLTPNATLKELQDSGRRTELLALQEEYKTYPLGAVWEEFCRRAGVPEDESWVTNVLDYEKNVLSKRG